MKTFDEALKEVEGHMDKGLHFTVLINDVDKLLKVVRVLRDQRDDEIRAGNYTEEHKGVLLDTYNKELDAIMGGGDEVADIGDQDSV